MTMIQTLGSAWVGYEAETGLAFGGSELFVE